MISILSNQIKYSSYSYEILIILIITYSILGLFTEFGPWRPIRDNGKLSLVRNPFTWSKYANLVFIEQPVGVGFSHSKEKFPHTGIIDISSYK